jgi:NTP pyrophosphatase (non-canonical NTP hydrolase)
MQTEPLTITAAQEAVDAWIRAHGGYWEPLAQLARLTEEVGEVAREINHHYGPKRKKPTETERALADELGDLLYIVIATANTVGVDLDAALRASLAKYTARDAGRYIGEGERQK